MRPKGAVFFADSRMSLAPKC